ncbi:MAG TPA: YIP1 family protein [Gemmatimonadaceae bacterium]|nr:YIP1 family protein [Gemmatimonadaceae bacterium]
MTTNLTSEPASPAQQASIWEDFVDIYTSPSSVFERRRDGRFGPALIVFTVAIGVLTWFWMDAMEPALSAQFAQAMQQARAANPNITEEQLSSMQGMMMTVGKFTALITVPFVVLLTGFAVWLIGKLFDASVTFAVGLTIAAYAQAPRVLKQAVETVQALFVDPSRLDTVFRVSLSPARFFGPPETSLGALAIMSRFDLFVIWMTVLIGIGVYVTARTTKRDAALVALIIWLVGGLSSFLALARQG